MSISIRSLFCNNAVTENSPVRALSTNMFYISNATYNISSNSIVFLDTKEGQFSLNLPPIPTAGDIIFLIDTGGNLENEPIRLLPNGHKIFKSTVDVNLSKSYMQYTLFYSNDDIGWVISECDLLLKGF